MERYFRLQDDVFVEDRWHLNGLYDSSGMHLDSRDLTYGYAVESTPRLRLSLAHDEAIVAVNQPLRVSISQVGKPLDFTFAAGDMPVVTRHVGQLLSSLAGNDIQRIPVEAEGALTPFDIVNVTARVDCIDAQKSEIMWWEKDNDIRPDLAGTPEMITRLVIDPGRVAGHHIFRLEGWDLAIIVSGKLRGAFEDAHVSGVLFEDVCAQRQ